MLSVTASRGLVRPVRGGTVGRAMALGVLGKSAGGSA